MIVTPRVSVIIPTHNHAHFLPECLSSVKAQTFKNYEVIVVNNGSTDNTEELIHNLSWDKLRYYYQDNTGSVAGPRNTGIHLAKGDYVAFLDSDDIWYKQKLEKVMRILEDQHSLDIISHDLYFLRAGRRKRVLKSGPLEKNMFKALLIKNRLLGSATVAKRNIMLEVGGFDMNRDFVHTEDYETWLRIAYLGKNFFFINEALGEYRVHSTNLSFDFEQALLNERNVINKHFANFKCSFIVYKYFLRISRLSVINSKLGTQYLFRRKYFKSMKYLMKSFFLNPFCFFRNIANIFSNIVQ